MKFEKCLTCDQLCKIGGMKNTCDGPNLYKMEPPELGQWLNEIRKSIPGMSYDRTAAETGVSKTSVYNFLSGTHPDVRLETVRRIIMLYLGNSDDNPCGNVSNSEKGAYEEEIRHLKSEIEWRDDKIAHLTGQHKELQDKFASMMVRHNNNQEFLRNDSKQKNRIIIALSSLAVISIIISLVAMIISLNH